MYGWLIMMLCRMLKRLLLKWMWLVVDLPRRCLWMKMNGKLIEAFVFTVIITDATIYTVVLWIMAVYQILKSVYDMHL
jgi:hypothetical protein